MSGSGSNRNHRREARTRAEAPEGFHSRASPQRVRRALALLTRTYHGGRQLGSYSLTFRICPPGQRLSAPLVPLERFAIRLKKRRIANQAIRIETTSLLETNEFCGAAWPSKVLKGKERNS